MCIRDSAIFILGIEGGLIFPPGLLCLYIGLDGNLVINSCCKVLVIGLSLIHISEVSDLTAKKELPKAGPMTGVKS